MAQRSGSRNNLIAGVFLLAAIVLAVAVAVVLSDAQSYLVRTHVYKARFTLDDGAMGLAPGSAVTVGGQEAGKVVKVEFETEPVAGEGGAARAVLVTFRLRADLRLYEDADVLLQIPLLGAGTQLNMTSMGGGEGASVLEPGETIRGRIATPSFLAQAGFGPEEAARIRLIVEDLAEMTERTNRLLEEIEPWVTDQRDGLGAIVADARAITGEVREKLPGWTQSLDATLTSAKESAEKVSGLVDQAQVRMEEARGVMESVRLAIDENRDRLDSIMVNVESATGKIDSETVTQLNETLASVGESAEQARAVLDETSAWVRRELPVIHGMIANGRLAADQLKLTAVEVRRSPWRLLYKPGKKELAEEILWSSARTYADAVSNLRATSEALGAISEKNPDHPSVDELNEQLREAFEAYKAAEADFLQRLAAEPG